MSEWKKNDFLSFLPNRLQRVGGCCEATLKYVNVHPPFFNRGLCSLLSALGFSVDQKPLSLFYFYYYYCNKLSFLYISTVRPHVLVLYIAFAKSVLPVSPLLFEGKLGTRPKSFRINSRLLAAGYPSVRAPLFHVSHS